MTKQSLLRNGSLSFLIFFCVLFACNSNGTNQTPPATDSSKSANQVDAAFTLTGKLDTLWAADTTFNKQAKGKIVFVFTIGGKDTLTLSGWNAKGKNEDSFDIKPDIILYKSGASSVTYEQGTYLGNVILKSKDVKTIKDSLATTHAGRVLFVPRKIDGHIQYDILLSTISHADADKQRIVVTGITANPSPPRAY